MSETRSRPRRPILCGEVLFDHFPDGHTVLGGAPFNVAWHLQAFGLRPLLISRIGADREGERIRAAMVDRGMDTSGLQVDPVYPTGAVHVSLDEGEPAFHVLPERAWDYLDAGQLPTLTDAGLLYTGSLIRRSPTSARAVEALQRPGLPRFLDVNLRTPWWSADAVLDMMRGARWLKLNEDELRRLSPDARPLAERAEALREQTGAEALLVTRGQRGAVLHTGSPRPLRVIPETGSKVVDSVGAGDAFVSVLIAGLLLDWPVRDTLLRAQAFATAIVGQRGAVPESASFYQPFLQAWQLSN